MARKEINGGSARPLVAVGLLAMVVALSDCTCSDNQWNDSCESSDECPAGQFCLDGQCRDRNTNTDAGDDGGGGGDCIDHDGDGYGIGPDCRGPDCDDADRLQTGFEVCDGHDNDCDGEADNGVLSPCGDCDPYCDAHDTGVGTDDPFDLDEDENEGVALNDEGEIVLDSYSVETDFIWIANTGAGQVVKVDTDTYEEMGRYATDTDPSRTSVNTVGDVYVGNRAGQSVTKVSVLGPDCPDTNGDGVITTSAGGGDVLPFGDDDCMLWHTELAGGGIIRAVAAQDEFGPDGEYQPYVWVGGWDGFIWKLDGTDGSIILQTASPVPPYGFALDAAGNLWISGLGGDLGRLDTTRCLDEASCAEAVCVGETAECDAAVKQRISMPDAGYGITVDFRQMVWLGGATIKRYDFSAPAGTRFTQVNVGPYCNGVGADALGFVYAACQGASTIVRVDGSDPTSWQSVSTQANRGIGIDADGKVWGINRSASVGCANVLTPGATVDVNPVEVGVGPVLSSPYTYSDMTGLQLRLATNPRGYYRMLVEGCEPPTDSEWGALSWEAEAPGGTVITVRVRTADSRDDLEAAEWITVATVPPDEPPADVGTALTDAGVEAGHLLQIEIILQAERTSFTEVITPRIRSVQQQVVCPSFVG